MTRSRNRQSFPAGFAADSRAGQAFIEAHSGLLGLSQRLGQLHEDRG